MKTKKKNFGAAAEWNETHAVGTPVKYYPIRDLPEYRVSRTRSEAYETQNGTMVMIDFQAGGVLLSHIGILNGASSEVERLLNEAELQYRKNFIARNLSDIGRDIERVATHLRNGTLKPDPLRNCVDHIIEALAGMYDIEPTLVPEFFCDRCAKERHFPTDGLASEAVCGICGHAGTCFERPTGDPA